MAESLILPDTDDRQVIYSKLTPQIKALISGETDLTANLANISAVLKEAFDFFWVGFYLKKEGQLVLGPFQGPLACTRINFDQGVCGRAYTTREIMIVPDVDQFPGHIACSSAARSEIVLPIFDNAGEVFGVLDVDSELIDDVTHVDADGLGRVVNIVERSFHHARPANL